MKQTTEKTSVVSSEQTNENNFGLQYDTTALSRIMKERGISHRSIMSLFGHTNPTTSARWMRGEQIPFQTLLSICNSFKINLFDFVTYYGNQVETYIDDLYRFELSGGNVADILRERNIDVYQPSKIRLPMNEQMIEADIKEHEKLQPTIAFAAKRYEEKQQEIHSQSLGASDIIDRIINIQRELTEHERQSLSQQRKEMHEAEEHRTNELKRQLKEKDEIILKLSSELSAAQAAYREAKLGGNTYMGYVSQPTDLDARK